MVSALTETDNELAESRETASPVRRLCSEIQLFDLCELDRCSFKEDRFCTNQELLEKFERIADVDRSSRISRDDGDDDLDDDELGYDDGYDDDFEDADEEWDDD